jgi:hypothetical protein
VVVQLLGVARGNLTVLMAGDDQCRAPNPPLQATVDTLTDVAEEPSTCAQRPEQIQQLGSIRGTEIGHHAARAAGRQRPQHCAEEDVGRPPRQRAGQAPRQRLGPGVERQVRPYRLARSARETGYGGFEDESFDQLGVAGGQGDRRWAAVRHADDRGESVDLQVSAELRDDVGELGASPGRGQWRAAVARSRDGTDSQAQLEEIALSEWYRGGHVATVEHEHRPCPGAREPVLHQAGGCRGDPSGRGHDGTLAPPTSSRVQLVADTNHTGSRRWR